MFLYGSNAVRCKNRLSRFCRNAAGLSILIIYKKYLIGTHSSELAMGGA